MLHCVPGRSLKVPGLLDGVVDRIRIGCEKAKRLSSTRGAIVP
jgi:hypothetical protein